MLLLYPFHSVCLTFVSLSVHPHIFSHSSAYRGDRCALVLVMPARLRDAISGILAGGIPGFGTATFFAWHLPVIFYMFGFELLLQG